MKKPAENSELDEKAVEQAVEVSRSKIPPRAKKGTRGVLRVYVSGRKQSGEESGFKITGRPDPGKVGIRRAGRGTHVYSSTDRVEARSSSEIAHSAEESVTVVGHSSPHFVQVSRGIEYPRSGKAQMIGESIEYDASSVGEVRLEPRLRYIERTIEKEHRITRKMVQEESKAVVDKLRADIQRYQEENVALRRELLLSNPTVRWIKASLAVMAICLFSLIAWLWRGFLVINPVVSVLGIVLSMGFLVMALMFQKEWQAQVEELSSQEDDAPST